MNTTDFSLIQKFWELFRWKMPALIFTGCVAAIFETLSITAFLPILLNLSSDPSQSGALQKIVEFQNSIYRSLGLESNLESNLLFFTILFLIRSIILILQSGYLSHTVSSALETQRNKLLQTIFAMSYPAYQKQSTGALTDLTVVQTERVIAAFEVFIQLSISIVFAIVYLSYPLVSDFTLILWVIASLLPAALIFRKLNFKTKNFSVQYSRETASFQSLLVQSFRHFKYLISTLSVPNILKQLKRSNRELSKIRFYEHFLGGLTQQAVEPYLAVILSFILLSFHHQQVRIEEKLFLLFFIYRAAKSITGSQLMFRKLIFFWGSMETVNHSINEFERKKESIRGEITPSKKIHEMKIEFKAVDFFYDQEKKVLKDFYWTIPPGSMQALIGQSGSGKSTLIGLLLKLLTPQSGEIFLDNIPIEKISTKWIRSQIGYLPQDPVFFKTSLKNNLTLWDSVNHQAGNTPKVFSELSLQQFENLEYDVTEDASNLSGGQKQRIGLARELLRNPSLLILDEPTSALDQETKTKVLQVLRNEKGKKTILVITHDHELLSDCDQVLNLNERRNHE